MKTIISIKKILLTFSLLISLSCYSQKANKVKILGTWNFDRIEFDSTMKIADSSDILTSSIGIMLTFKTGNKFITKRKTKDGTKLVESGTYRITDDGKKIIQNDEEAEIILLTDKILVFKVEEVVIMHMKRKSP